MERLLKIQTRINYRSLIHDYSFNEYLSATAKRHEKRRTNRIIIDGDTIRKRCYPFNYDYSRVIVRSLKANEHQFHQVRR